MQKGKNVHGKNLLEATNTHAHHKLGIHAASNSITMLSSECKKHRNLYDVLVGHVCQTLLWDTFVTSS